MSSPVAYCRETACNILLLFVSPVSDHSMKEPPRYHIFGKNYVCMQTNESAVIYCREMLSGRMPDGIFLIASETVQKEGETPYGRMSHLAYLKRRIQEIYGNPDIEKRMKTLDYKDTLADMDEAVMGLSGVAGELSAFLQGREKESYLHADMTGGFRHASMMMLAIMQLTKFLGIHMGQILYSEPKQHAVYVANKIHAMFDLVSGVDEFVQFGSVNTLQRYFNQSLEEQSKELQELLIAMQNFSDAIRLCRTESIQSIMSTLRQRIEAFGQSGGTSSEEKVFLQLLQRVKDEYEMVTQEASTELDVIQWCIKKGQWQQALTFSTERLPIYIVDHHICEPGRKDYQRKDDGLHRHWQQIFIVTEIQPMSQSFDRVVQAKTNLVQFFRSLLVEKRQQIVEDLKALDLSQKKFDLLIREIERADQLVAEIRKHVDGCFQPAVLKRNINKVYPMAFMQQHSMFSRLLKFLYFAMPDDNQSYLSFIYKNITRESILRRLLACNPDACVVQDEICLLVRMLQRGKAEQVKPKERHSAEEKWRKRELQWRNAFANGFARTAYPEKQEQVIELLKRFHYLREERNRINHASDTDLEGTGMDIDKVRDMTQECLRMIRAIEE